MDKLLDANDSSKYYIMFSNYRCNHLSHGVVSLARLGASHEQLDHFVTWYSDRLEKPNGPTSKKYQSSQENIEELLGAEANFYQLVAYYREKYEDEYHSDLGRLVRLEFHKLSSGIVNAAFHPLIHIGYGLAGNSANTVIDGLAYLHMTYMPIKTTETSVVIGSGEHNFKKVIAMFSKDERVNEFLCQQRASGKWNKPLPEKVANSVTLIGDLLVEFANKVDIHVQPADCCMQDVIKLGRKIISWAAYIYAKSKPVNNFYLLHGITASWGLLKILEIYTSTVDALEVIHTMICCLFVLYLCEGNPEITEEPYKLIYNNWTDIIDATFQNLESKDKPNYDHPSQFDEHVYKLVQVVYGMSKETDITDTVTHRLYKEAANIVLNELSVILDRPQFEHLYK